MADKKRESNINKDNNIVRLRKSPTKVRTAPKELTNPTNQVNEVRHFVSKVSPSSTIPPDNTSTPKSKSGHQKRHSISTTKNNIFASNKKPQISTSSQIAKKKKTIAGIRSPRKNQPKGDGKNETSLMISPEKSTPGTSHRKSPLGLNKVESPLSKRDAVLIMKDVQDTPNSRQLFEPSEESKDAVIMMRADKTSLRLSSNSAFRKNTMFQQNQEERKSARKRPEDYQLHPNGEESVLSIEEPTVDLYKDHDNEVRQSSNLDTLHTQIEIEETNIKKIGVSGTKPKGVSGSMTERQSHLLMMSSSSNTQIQLETSQATGPTLPRRQEKSLTRRGGTIDNRQVGFNQLHFKGQQMNERHSLVSSFERGNSISVLSATQVTPFQQQALIIQDQQLTNTELTAKLQKLKNLDKIDVTQNKITIVPYPDLLNHSISLTQLCLDNNQIVEISEESLRQCACLVTLKLRGNQLIRLPDSLFSLAQLRILDVSCNKLSQFSAKVSLLRQLRWLNIAENRLEGLPNSIGYLDHLETVTSEYFVYLPDQGSSNIQVEQIQTGDPELDWITQHHKRQSLVRNSTDGRFEKLMSFMRLQISVTSELFDLVHEFQQLGGEYQMLDSEPVIMTEESDQLIPIHSLTSLHGIPSSALIPQESQTNVLQVSPSNALLAQQHQQNQLVADPSTLLGPSNLPVYAKYLPREEYNQIVTVFRTLEPQSSNYNSTMLHNLITNNHPHLLRQFYNSFNKVLTNGVQNLQSAEVADRFRSKSHQHTLIRNLKNNFNAKLKNAINMVNERGWACLDLVLQGMQVETADVFIQLFGKYLDLDCQTGLRSTPKSEVCIIVPGNHQQATVEGPGPVNKGAMDGGKLKQHPIVTTLTNGRFQLASKLIDVALESHFKRIAEERLKSQQDSLLREPSASHQSISMSSVFMNHAALQIQVPANQVDINAPFSLNIADSEQGQTFLHHLFATFDTSPEQAANLFRKMNSLHNRMIRGGVNRSLGQDPSNSLAGVGGIGLMASAVLLGKKHKVTNAIGLASPLHKRGGKLRLSVEPAAVEPSTTFSRKRSSLQSQTNKLAQSVSKLERNPDDETKQLLQASTSAVQNKASSPMAGQQVNINQKIKNAVSKLSNSSPKGEIEPLELNPLTHYCETPFELAIEHFQNLAVQFALNWNFNHVQSIKFARQQQQQQQSRSKSTNPAQRSKARGASHSRDDDSHLPNRFQGQTTVVREPTLREFFDLMSQQNPRKHTPLHRAVISGNYNSLKILLDSPLHHSAHELAKSLSGEMQAVSLIDVHRQDKYGKTARDYSHKIVFMSKLLCQAIRKQVWQRADLYTIKEQLLQSTQSVSTDQRSAKGDKQSVLATYDKLIAHTSINSRKLPAHKLSRSLKANQLIGGGLLSDNFVFLRHTHLNLVFLSRAKPSSFLKSRCEVRHSDKPLSGMLKQSQIDPTARSQGQNQRRVVKSFATNTPSGKPSTTLFAAKHNSVHKVGGEKQGVGLGLVMTPSQIGSRKMTGKVELADKQQTQTYDAGSVNSGGLILRQSVPSSTKGIKKAKSMAFNSLSNRLDRDSQARQFLNQAKQKQEKLMLSTKPPIFREQVPSQATPTTHPFANDNEMLQPHMHLSNSHRLHQLDSQSTTNPLQQDNTTNGLTKSSPHPQIDARYGKTQSALSGRVRAQGSQQSLLKEEDEGTVNDQDDSVDSITLVEGEPQSVFGGTVSNRLDSVGAGFSPSLKQRTDFVKEGNARHGGVVGQSMEVGSMKSSSRGLGAEHVGQIGKTSLIQRSLQADQKLGSSLLNLAKEQIVSQAEKNDTSPQKKHYLSAQKAKPKPQMSNNQDALKLADLEPSPRLGFPKVKADKTSSSVEITHDFNDSGSANSFTPLPSIQNDYALEIKSFNAYWKKPYSQQLSTNVFKEQFDLIMDNQCDQGQTIVEEDGINNQRLNNESLRLIRVKPLQPHQKVQLLFDIVNATKDAHKVQDAKDIFDFIQYEIGSQTQLAKTRRADLLDKNKKQNQEEEKKANGPGRKTNPNPTVMTQKMVLSQRPLNDEILFLRQEVSYLRCQLDLIAKQMAAIPMSETQAREEMLERSASESAVNERLTSSHIDTYAGHDTQDQFTELSATGTITHTDNKQILSCRNPSQSEALNSAYAMDVAAHTVTEQNDVTHLTEADQELSDDFDENVNTVKQPTKKKHSRLVKPSDMLGSKVFKVSNTLKTSSKLITASGPSAVAQNQSTSSQHPSQQPHSRLSNLLGLKKDKPQKLHMSRKRKSLKQLEPMAGGARLQHSQSRPTSKENLLETDEGQTVINQPLISAELQSFSDRLSQHRASATNQSYSLINSKKQKNSLLKMASRTVKMLPREPNVKTGSVETHSAAKSSETIQNESRILSSATQNKEPKLKYAAFAQIDLSTFDFQKRNLSSQKREPLQEKSRSVIAIPKSHTFTGNSPMPDKMVVRAATCMGSDFDQQSVDNRTVQNLNPLNYDDMNSSRDFGAETQSSVLLRSAIETNERHNDVKYMMIQEEKIVPPKKSNQQKDPIFGRSDSFKNLGLGSKQPLHTKTKKAIPSSKKPILNLGTLTSQKASLKVLQEYQKSRSRVGNNVPPSAALKATEPASGSAVKIGQSSAHTYSKASHQQPKFTHLSQLSAAAINLPPQTTKHSSNAQHTKGPSRLGAALGLSNTLAKSTYLQPKVARAEKPNYHILSKPKPKAQASRVTQSAAQGTGAPPKPQEGTSFAQPKIKTHHRLLRDLVENPLGSRSKNLAPAANKLQ